MALARMSKYSDRMILVKASPAVTTLRAIREMTARLVDATGGNVTVFVDYLQKVAIHPERASDENEKITIVVEGLKDIALALDVPAFAIVAAHREGLKSKRLHLYHLRATPALKDADRRATLLHVGQRVIDRASQIVAGRASRGDIR